MALVLLKTGIGHPGDADYDTMRDGDGGGEGEDGETGQAHSDGYVKFDAQQMATAQKLLLFWRKPAVRIPSLSFSLAHGLRIPPFLVFPPSSCPLPLTPLFADPRLTHVPICPRTHRAQLTAQRKCWWDGVEVDVPVSSTSKETHKVKVWARRVWTLELSLVSALAFVSAAASVHLRMITPSLTSRSSLACVAGPALGCRGAPDLPTGCRPAPVDKLAAVRLAGDSRSGVNRRTSAKRPSQCGVSGQKSANAIHSVRHPHRKRMSNVPDVR